LLFCARLLRYLCTFALLTRSQGFTDLLCYNGCLTLKKYPEAPKIARLVLSTYNKIKPLRRRDTKENNSNRVRGTNVSKVKIPQSSQLRVHGPTRKQYPDNMSDNMASSLTNKRLISVP